MPTLRRATASLVFALAVQFAWQGAAHANLITNGSFETGDFTGWTQGGNLGFTSVESGPEYVYTGAEDGSFYSFMGPVGSDGTLSQLISDAAGQSLRLSYWLAGVGDDSSDFEVLWNGIVIPGSANTDFDSGAAFTNFQFDVVGTGSDTLTFGFRDDPAFMALDNISLDAAAVPEPGTLGLMGLGLLGIGRLFRRSKTRSHAA